MSFLSEVKSLEAKGEAWGHTVTSWCAKEYQVFRKEEPTLVALSDRVFPYIKSAVQIALQLEGESALSAPAGALLDTIHAKADTAAALIYDFGANPTVSSAVADVQQNLGQFEAVAGIKSTSAKDAIAKAISGAAGLQTAVQGAIAVAKAATVPAAK
jgi:hypothetical protein